MMTCYILCGGQGSRLKNIISDRPKSLAPIPSTRFLDVLINYLSQFPIDRFVLLAGHLGHQIQSIYAQKDRIDVLIEKEILGTGGAVINALKTYAPTENLFIVNGDTFAEIPPHFFSNFSGGLRLACARSQDQTGRYLRIKQSQGIVSSMSRDPSLSTQIHSGILLVHKNIVKNWTLKDTVHCQLEADLVIPELKNKTPIEALTLGGKFIDIGTPHDFKKAPNYLKEFH